MLRIDDLNINYKIIGDGDLVVLLHGWGQNIEMMQPLVGGLKNKKVLRCLSLSIQAKTPTYRASSAYENAYGSHLHIWI